MHYRIKVAVAGIVRHIKCDNDLNIFKKSQIIN